MSEGRDRAADSRALIPWTLSFLRPHRGRVTALVLLLLAQIVLGALQPWPLKIVIDYALGARPLPEPFGPWILAVTGGNMVALLVLFVALGVILQLANQVASALGVQVRVLDLAGAVRAPGEVGEVVIRGANVTIGYWNKPEETAAALRDGWYHTGDLGYLDDESRLYLVDRLKDMVVTGGENVYTVEVEDILASHPQVAEAAVFGVPDDHWGESLYAVVVPREQVNAEELVEYCRERIAGFKIPKHIEVTDEPLPKSGVGKVLKRELREPFWSDRETRIGN